MFRHVRRQILFILGYERLRVIDDDVLFARSIDAEEVKDLFIYLDHLQ